MRKTLSSIILLLSLNTFAGVTLECNSVYGNSVYTTFYLKTVINDNYGMPYDLEDIIGSAVTLNGIPNPNHDDVMETDEWNFVTLGPREAFIKSGSKFSIETCENCDFNGAEYEYKKSNEDEIFFTEMYGSDGSGEFSLYKCNNI